QSTSIVNNDGRATTLNTRTLEHIHSIDPTLAQRILRVSRTYTDVHYYVDGALVRTGVAFRSDSQFAFATQCPQAIVQGIFIDYLASRGVHVERQIRLVDFEDSFESDGVSAMVENLSTGKMSAVEVAYLVGADGPKSVTRMKLGIPLKGFGTPNLWFMMDVSIIHTNLPTIEYRNHVENKHGVMFTLVSSDNLYRFCLRTNAEEDDFGPEEVMARIKLVLRPFELEFDKVYWFTRYDGTWTVASVSAFCFSRHR
ncbi:FAD-binding monooxygenase, partial [Jimgerdemannia flammicorona]